MTELFTDEDNILISELRIVQYVDSEGGLNTLDCSQATGGEELGEKAYMDLIGWALGFALAPKVAAVLQGAESDESDG